MYLERIITNFKFKSKVVKVSPTEVVEINGYELFITLKLTTVVICNMYHACAHNEKEITVMHGEMEVIVKFSLNKIQNAE